MIVGILVLSGLGAVAITENKETEYKTFTISFSQPLIKTENDYVSISIDETNTFLREQGKPMLPSYIYTFSFPFGTKIKKVTCELSNFQEKTLTKHIKPSPKISYSIFCLMYQSTNTISCWSFFTINFNI